MPHAATTKNRALEFARTRGIARARDFAAEGIAPVYLQRLVSEGQLIRTRARPHQLADSEFAAAHTLAEAARIVPHGVVCLLSALQVHELTTQTPHLVWMIGPRKWAPTSSPVGLQIVRATGEALTAGIEHHTVEGVPVPVTGPAKTVADCFKHRRKVGLDGHRGPARLPAAKGLHDGPALALRRHLPRAVGHAPLSGSPAITRPRNMAAPWR